jgi:hypothetical protein
MKSLTGDRHCLSLVQPWATFVVHGLKLRERRRWKTRHRGPTWIHASTTFPEAVREACREEPFRSLLARCGIWRTTDLALGAIVGRVRLIDCEPTSSVEWDEMGDFRPGRWTWRFAEAEALAAPVPCSGQVGVFVLARALAARLRDGQRHSREAPGGRR